MSLFDDLEDKAMDVIIQGDTESATLYHMDETAAQADGFNRDYKRDYAATKTINIAISRGESTAETEYIGTTTETEIYQGDLLVIFDERGEKREFVVGGFRPVRGHTLLNLNEVTNDGA